MHLLDALLHGGELEVGPQRRELVVAGRLLELPVALGGVELHPLGGQTSGFGHCHGHFLDAHLFGEWGGGMGGDVLVSRRRLEGKAERMLKGEKKTV